MQVVKDQPLTVRWVHSDLVSGCTILHWHREVPAFGEMRIKCPLLLGVPNSAALATPSPSPSLNGIFTRTREAAGAASE